MRLASLFPGPVGAYCPIGCEALKETFVLTHFLKRMWSPARDTPPTAEEQRVAELNYLRYVRYTFEAYCADWQAPEGTTQAEVLSMLDGAIQDLVDADRTWDHI